MIEKEDEVLVDETKDATASVKEKLRPADMIPTHGGAFQEEDSYHMQVMKYRAQTTINTYLPVGGGKNNINDPAMNNFKEKQMRAYGPIITVGSSLSHYGSER